MQVYFEDETRYWQKTICTGIWGFTNSSIEYINQNGFLNAWIYGVVNPKSGGHFGLVLPRLDGQNMQIFLDEFSKTISKRDHIVMVCDGSQAHKTGSLQIPSNISLIFLPPYSPKLNPIERLWKYIKSKYLSFKRYANLDEIIDAGVCAWNPHPSDPKFHFLK